MSKTFKAGLAATAMFTALAAAAAPMTASAMPQANGITNCDAPGGRQQAGAAIGAVLGGLAGSQVSKNERALGAVVGAGAGAAAGSYIGCNQQRTRAAAQSNANMYRATSNLRIRPGPGTQYRQAGSVGRSALHGHGLAGRVGADRRRRLGQRSLRGAELIGGFFPRVDHMRGPSRKGRPSAVIG